MPTKCLRSAYKGNGKQKTPATLSVGIARVYCSDPNGIRTRVAALKGPCPRPLDDGAEVRIAPTAAGRETIWRKRSMRQRRVRHFPQRNPFFPRVAASLLAVSARKQRILRNSSCPLTARFVIKLTALGVLLQFPSPCPPRGGTRARSSVG